MLVPARALADRKGPRRAMADRFVRRIGACLARKACRTLRVYLQSRANAVVLIGLKLNDIRRMQGVQTSPSV